MVNLHVDPIIAAHLREKGSIRTIDVVSYDQEVEVTYETPTEIREAVFKIQPRTDPWLVLVSDTDCQGS